jgi:hypothetical protein
MQGFNKHVQGNADVKIFRVVEILKIYIYTLWKSTCTLKAHISKTGRALAVT